MLKLTSTHQASDGIINNILRGFLDASLINAAAKNTLKVLTIKNRNDTQKYMSCTRWGVSLNFFLKKCNEEFILFIIESIVLTFQQQQNYYKVEHKLCTCCTTKIAKLDMLNYYQQTGVSLLRLYNVVLFRSKILQALTGIFKII